MASRLSTSTEFRRKFALLGLSIPILASAFYFGRLRPELRYEASTNKGGDVPTFITERIEGLTPEGKVAKIASLLDDPDRSVRFGALEEIAEHPDPKFVAMLDRSYGDSNSHLRRRAMEITMQCDPEAGLRAAVRGLRDDDDWIRDAAMSQIVSRSIHKRKGDERIIPIVAPLVDSNSESMRLGAVVSLTHLTGNHWRTHGGMTAEQRDAVFQKWRTWWSSKKPSARPSELDSISGIPPTRMDPAPTFQAQTIGGQQVNTESFRGKVLLISFWATWCPYCVGEAGGFIEIDRDLRNKGLASLGIALERDEQGLALRAMVQREGITYPQIIATTKLLESFDGLREVPVTMLIDRKGNLRYQWDGQRDVSTFRAAAERLLAEK